MNGKSLWEQYQAAKPLWVEGYTLTKKDVESIERLLGAGSYYRDRADRYLEALERLAGLQTTFDGGRFGLICSAEQVRTIVREALKNE
jgi:hypothetical protein